MPSLAYGPVIGPRSRRERRRAVLVVGDVADRVGHRALVVAGAAGDAADGHGRRGVGRSARDRHDERRRGEVVGAAGGVREPWLRVIVDVPAVTGWMLSPALMPQPLPVNVSVARARPSRRAGCSSGRRRSACRCRCRRSCSRCPRRPRPAGVTRKVVEPSGAADVQRHLLGDDVDRPVEVVVDLISDGDGRRAGASDSDGADDRQIAAPPRRVRALSQPCSRS